MIFPRISIVTPNLNGGLYLEQTIKSVLDQNYPNLEYIIIDGGSHDDSIDIIRKYNGKLYFWVSEPDSGMYYAIQKGFEKSTGQIMAWLNSDDIYHPNSLFSIAEIFQIPGISWFQGNPTSIDETSRTVDIACLKSWSKYKFYLNEGGWIQQESTFWRRSLWDIAGGVINTKYKYAADYDLWNRFFKYEQLFTANCLVGGFRTMKSDQISKTYYSEYLKEAEIVRATNVFDDRDVMQLNKIERLKKLRRLFIKSRFLNTNIILKRLEHKLNSLYLFPRPLYFEWESQTYKFF